MVLGNEVEPVAAVDLGSNSFHMVVGRVLGGQLSLIDRLRDPVRLAAGLDADGRIAEETIEAMLASLQRFRERLAGIPVGRVRAIGTNTFRKARLPRDLLRRASDALGYPIEVLPGPEEARLIYLGVCHEQAHTEGRRLVVDIGGGSTECILGRGFTPIFTDSLSMGCVSYSLRFFDGELYRKAFQRAEIAARLELETIERRFRGIGWTDAVGSSGTISAISTILREAGWSDGVITLGGLKKLRKAIVAAGSVEALELPGLVQDRRPVIAGGLAILKATFDSLRIAELRHSKAALREGLLYDLLGRIRHEDVRDRTIRALSERYHVDEQQASRVEEVALHCLEDVAESWSLDTESSSRLLGWAARMHEIGLALAYAGYHKHGAYILQNSALPGFSRDDQLQLAVIVRGHRRKLSDDVFAPFTNSLRERVFRLCVLLRIAVRLCRARGSGALPSFGLRAERDRVEISFEPGWLESHPMTRADLEDEAVLLGQSGIEFAVSEM